MATGSTTNIDLVRLATQYGQFCATMDDRWQRFTEFCVRVDAVVQRLTTAYREGHSRQSIQLAKIRPSPDPRGIPTEEQLAIWDLLQGESLTAKEIAVRSGLGPDQADAVRQKIARLNKHGFRIENTRGIGYWRPDARPADHATG
ncbi:MAG: hypothetical protein AAGB51_14075 [Planctomycetota bacterium]